MVENSRPNESTRDMNLDVQYLTPYKEELLLQAVREEQQSLANAGGYVCYGCSDLENLWGVNVYSALSYE